MKNTYKMFPKKLQIFFVPKKYSTIYENFLMFYLIKKATINSNIYFTKS